MDTRFGRPGSPGGALHCGERAIHGGSRRNQYRSGRAQKMRHAAFAGGPRSGRQLSPEARHAPSESDASGPGTSIAASAETSADRGIDVKEYNRGRLIGDLERIVLTIVVAGGSYAALAFLVAAKGVVRSDEFENNRDFAEYFLIGSLSSVLVALCAGLALRFALLQLWPGLLGLQMQ
jgi:hypothetical protein